MQTFHYPSNTKIKEVLGTIVEYQLITSASDLTRDATHKLAAALDAALPYAIVYQQHIKNLQVTEQDLIERLPEYENFPPQLKNKVKNELKAMLKSGHDEIDRFVDFLQHHTNHVNNWQEENIDTLIQVQEEMGV